jgi:hypothetical protein
MDREEGTMPEKTRYPLTVRLRRCALNLSTGALVHHELDAPARLSGKSVFASYGSGELRFDALDGDQLDRKPGALDAFWLDYGSSGVEVQDVWERAALRDARDCALEGGSIEDRVARRRHRFRSETQRALADANLERTVRRGALSAARSAVEKRYMASTSAVLECMRAWASGAAPDATLRHAIETYERDRGAYVVLNRPGDTVPADLIVRVLCEARADHKAV